ncbi:Uu.00g070600.m01.CDS01 [Anthostomella pinea]|uniref:Uu.00g070600.m01.CDS01 n=1 Tax=Anthostomella pinea TaxID=933095 RepID=A0AAI8YNQ5_9PEZI|nr:Uu.00g070600.m01.CDS01 [Anthostomella pinea]
MEALLRVETLRCFSLVFLSLLLLPVSIVTIWINRFLYEIQSISRPAFERKTILVTGVGMAKGLTLARVFHRCGHRAIGADFESRWIPCSGRYSKSLSRFYRLPKPNSESGAQVYIERLLEIIDAHKVDLWVSCSGVASAFEDAQAKEAIEKGSPCKCIQFDVSTTSALHEKDAFMRACTDRDLPVPETYDIKYRDEVFGILAEVVARHPDRRFILKPVGMDDLHRANMTLLPLSSERKTNEHVCRLPISPANPWILQQFISGGEEYCTHALVVRGVVHCFVACPSAELLMHYEALPRTSALWQAMLEFTVQFIDRSPDPEAMTGHLSFDFMVENGAVRADGFERKIYAIECNPRAHTAVVLFAQAGPEERDMVRAYLSATDPVTAVLSDDVTYSMAVSGEKPRVSPHLVMPPQDTQARYWVAHDLISLLNLPLVQMDRRRMDLRMMAEACFAFLIRLLTWKDGTFEAWDPWPALVLYHVYWPLTILDACWHGRGWSRVNVSTTKMFAC